MKKSQFLHTTADLNTFGVEHPCTSIHVVEREQTLQDLLHRLEDPLVLGGGSNVLFTGPMERPLLIMANDTIDVVGESSSAVLVRCGAGTHWHKLVLWAVAHDYGGIENLSLIPGKCGAAPMQNIGAYGVELESVFVELEAMRIHDQKRMIFDGDDCQFGYRSSIFKHELADQLVITNVTLRLAKKGHHHLQLEYGAIRSKLEEMGVRNPGIDDVSRAVIDIRRSKLPDPVELPNAGSFFKNPIVTHEKYQKLIDQYPHMPHYPAAAGVKLAAGWLIEQCGWKGKRIGQVGTYPYQALVIVNYGTHDGKEILAFSEKIQQSVAENFGINLEREVNVYGLEDDALGS